MFYALFVLDNIHDMCLVEDSELLGPFKTKKQRNKVVDTDLRGRDLEYCQVHVTLLQTTPSGKLEKTDSFIPDPDDYCDEDD